MSGTINIKQTSHAIEIIENINSEDIKPTSNDLQCAPHLSFTDNSCISLHVLVKMANAYNKEYPDNKIILNQTQELMSPRKYKKYLLYQFKKRIPECDTQKCWTKQDFINKLDAKIKKQLLKETFRPDSPEGKFTWLNTSNIDNVMFQYELKYPEFKYLSTVPLDFDNLDYYPLKNINFKKLIDSGKTKIGVVFNMDYSNMSGSHWCGLFANFENCESYYSDSYGVPPPKEIVKFMKKIAIYMKKNKCKNPNIKYNTQRHQRGGNACGMYSINFILRLLDGESFKDICNKRIPDEDVNHLRNVYFESKGHKYKN